MRLPAYVMTTPDVDVALSTSVDDGPEVHAWKHGLPRIGRDCVPSDGLPWMAFITYVRAATACARRCSRHAYVVRPKPPQRPPVSAATTPAMYWASKDT